MLKMSLLTLVGLYAILAVAGREAPGPAPVAVPEAASAQIERPAPVAAVTPAALIETPDAAARPAALIVAQPAAVRMPGPALRPAPEYRRPEPLAAAPAGAALYRVIATRLNVRATPGGAVLDQVTAGEEVLVTAAQGAWMKIRIEGDGVEGWVSGKLLAPAR
ncbi:hypothetical protein LPB142_13985 [Rhodobacter xanthinilyticus]|uniref:SH3b domain-containing protein n=1 Tax=Rhodobacter xanthinilyticus TaxID=1850250 RepID=A0A1D9MEK3_9RHOB|nr:SH3 domain-containing protein [Rhodobacter xanthinilyticus]AOZ70294.1 hypothetical protein LPB142_13985 [Rhodobacter xanthinilyticus]